MLTSKLREEQERVVASAIKYNVKNLKEGILKEDFLYITQSLMESLSM